MTDHPKQCKEREWLYTDGWCLGTCAEECAYKEWLKNEDSRKT